MREVSLEAFQVDENVAMWTIICRSTVLASIASNNKQLFNNWMGGKGTKNGASGVEFKGWG